MPTPRVDGWPDTVRDSFDRVRTRIDGVGLVWSGALVFLGLLAVYLPTASYDLRQSPDPLAAAIPAWQFAVRATFDLDAFADMVAWFVEGQHYVVSDRMPGVIFFAIPFYWALPTSSTTPTLLPAAVAAATATAGAMTVLHVVLRRLVSPSTALAGAVLAGLGTATWSVSADGLWPHGIDQLWLALGLVGLAAGAWSASGLSFALAVFTRPLTAVVAAVTGLHASWRRRSAKPALLMGATSLLGVAGVLAYHAALFGQLTLVGGYARRAEAFLPPDGPLEYLAGVAGTLVSPDRGILVLSPFLLALLPGLPRAWRAAPPWARAAAVSGVVYMLAHLAVNRFSGGNNFFSYRLPLEMLTVCAPLLALAWREWTARTRLRRLVFLALACLSVLVHAFGAAYWVPIFEARSPWTNFKLADAVASAGLAAIPLVAVIVALGVLFVVATGVSRVRSRP